MAAESLFAKTSLDGQFVTLSKLTYEDMPSLWRNLDPLKSVSLWDYLILDPPKTLEDLWQQVRPKPGVATFAVRGNISRLDHKKGTEIARDRADVMGVVAYMNIDDKQRGLDIGSVILSPALQRTVASTEIQFLLLRHVFEDLGMAVHPLFHRVLWKCNAKNDNSRRAAQRLGFVYEGTLRRNRLVRGSWIDSAWFSVVDDEWPAIKEALISWLDASNFSADGQQRRSLLECREKVLRKNNIYTSASPSKIGGPVP